jgi:ABC-type multidrug transport system fused ATPase/permease subunit
LGYCIAVQTILRVVRYLRRYPLYALGTVSCAILTTLLALVYPKLTQVMVDDVIGQKRGNLLLPWAGVLLLAFLGRDLFNSLRIRLNNAFEQKVIFDLRRDLYGKLQRLSVAYYDQRATGDIMTRIIDDVNSVERVLIDGTEQGTVAALTLVGVTAMMFSFNPSLAVLVWIPIPLLMAAAVLYTRHAHQRYRIQRRAMSALNALLHDNLQGIRQIKSFGREEHEISRFEAKSDRVRRGTLDAMRLWATYSPATSFIASLGYVIVFCFGGYGVIRGRMTLGQLVGFLGYLSMFYSPIERLHGINQMLQAARAAGERVFEIIDAPEEVTEKPHAGKLSDSTRGEVEFRQVSFHYENRRDVLQQIDIQVRPGQTIALVGPTGAGKSTLVHLLPRFHDVTAGCILIDGVDIRDVTLESLRRHIGIVTQEPFLFNGTVRENIMYGRLDASEQEMIAAAQAANAHEFISRLSEGYDSRVGERGVKFSVGEKQRVSIARVLLKDPRILILDEATASIDTHTEQMIQEALERLMADRTSFVIAHRLSTVRNADVILVIDQGRIAERGSHDELLRADGIYAQLCKAQGKTLAGSSLKAKDELLATG